MVVESIYGVLTQRQVWRDVVVLKVVLEGVEIAVTVDECSYSKLLEALIAVQRVL